MEKLERPIRHAKITHDMTAGQLVDSLSGCAFGAGRLYEAVDIYREMQSDRECTRFFGLAGAMVPAGMRQIVSDLIRDREIDILVTTGANLVHDIIESMRLHHYRGTDATDDIELKHHAINRIYDVFLPEEHFVKLEEKLRPMFSNLPDRLSISELLSYIGSKLDDDGSILKSAYDMHVPVYCPAIQDSIIGLQAWLYKQTEQLNVDVFADMNGLIDRCYEAKRAGVLIVGGGVPKNFILQSMLITPKSFDYAIQLTMDRPETGGLSGATLDEARSWGKIGEKARSVTVYSDATITLPIIVAAAKSAKWR
ncbi:deoxyhypusine synthase [Candidatus Methanoperedens nitroreducens]|uniref:Probable deoxyhypusine synthase n=1 Tax=Candidatus Methanoperedens nitratireducens TaxID=1392998 RepID=A0A062V160_9EURY|nr:deoxyhypusine synthase [Candidatus Methanoperedens nitroreducens]KCZ71122.1 deoxyhypusine synthase [Candidatus Methanoperedens nitroreducens]MDJ1421500.1 deoxyhypusine synthase [Candidatus Methanoperedens sp.]